MTVAVSVPLFVSTGSSLQNFLDQREHPVLIEAAIPQIRILPAPDFQLAGLLGAVHGDARLLEPPTVLGAMGVLDDVDGAAASGLQRVGERFAPGLRIHEQIGDRILHRGRRGRLRPQS
jgi:hypothetical protein